MRSRHWVVGAGTAFSLGCGHTGGQEHSEPDTDAGTASAPERDFDHDGGTTSAPPDGGASSSVPDHRACSLSADCAAGFHCDLSECVRDCGPEIACDSGKSCSPRGRCLGAGEPDADPAPVTKGEGEIHADPSRVS